MRAYTTFRAVGAQRNRVDSTESNCGRTHAEIHAPWLREAARKNSRASHKSDKSSRSTSPRYVREKRRANRQWNCEIGCFKWVKLAALSSLHVTPSLQLTVSSSLSLVFLYFSLVSSSVLLLPFSFASLLVSQTFTTLRSRIWHTVFHARRASIGSDSEQVLRSWSRHVKLTD